MACLRAVKNRERPAARHRCPWSTTAPVDGAGAERAIHDLLVALGRDVSDPGLRETRRRVAAAFAELLCGEPVTLTTTSALLGLLRDDARTRSEFLALARG
jgi:GTP cyclohydrolase I